MSVDDQRVDRALKRLLRGPNRTGLRLPSTPRVVGLRHELITDSAGDDAVQIWVILDDDTPEAHWTDAKLGPIERALRSALRKKGIDRWAYVSFRSESEQRRTVSNA